MSGTRRLVPGCGRPACQDGRGTDDDWPPPPAYPLNVPVAGSLQTVSVQAPVVPVSRVPPTPTTDGETAGKSTVTRESGAASLEQSYAPTSPLAANTVAPAATMR